MTEAEGLAREYSVLPLPSAVAYRHHWRQDIRWTDLNMLIARSYLFDRLHTVALSLLHDFILCVDFILLQLSLPSAYAGLDSLCRQQKATARMSYFSEMPIAPWSLRTDRFS